MKRAEFALLKRLNAVCPYYTMFPLDFPFARLGAADKGDWVIDPFCGRGSTNYAARLRGLPSIGVDSSPVAVAIAKAKLTYTTPARIIDTCRRILEKHDEPEHVPSGAFWERALNDHTLRQVCKLREDLMKDCQSASRIALRALLLGRLHGPMTRRPPRSYLSNQMPRTYASKPAYAVRFWRSAKMYPPRVDVLEMVKRKAAEYFTSLPETTSGRIIRGDSRTIPLRQHLTKRARWVITSPPYYGMRTYVPDQWMRNWFVGGSSSVAYNFEGQLKHSSPQVFAEQLALVWANVAEACLPGARLVVRFGGIPDRAADPFEILRESLLLADAGWRMVTTKTAGRCSRGRRQASQFLRQESVPVDEFDAHATLDT